MLNSTLCFSISAAGLFGISISISTGAGAVFRAVRAKTGERPVYREAAEALPAAVTADVLTSHRADADAPWERRPLPGSCPVRLLHAGQRSTKQYCTRAQVKVFVPITVIDEMHAPIDADQTSRTVKVANMFFT